MSGIKSTNNSNHKVVGSAMFVTGALSLSLALKMLSETVFPPYVLKYASEQTMITYTGLILLLFFASYKLISKSYIMLTPYLK